MRRPYVLAAVTWGYLAWSFLPLAVALAISIGRDPLTREVALNLDAYRAALRGTGMRSVFVQSVRLALGTVVVAVPMGTAPRPHAGSPRPPTVALGGGHPCGDDRGPARRSRLRVLLPVRFRYPRPSEHDHAAHGHVTVALPFVALVVWTRVLFLDTSYEEQSADLGASPWSTVTRVLLPLCTPAILVAATVAFAVSFNELPLSRYLCTPIECQTSPMLIERDGGDAPPPALAIAIIATGLSVALVAVTLLVTRAVVRRQAR